VSVDLHPDIFFVELVVGETLQLVQIGLVLIVELVAVLRGIGTRWRRPIGL
jgi:hypothetical protein